MPIPLAHLASLRSPVVLLDRAIEANAKPSKKAAPGRVVHHGGHRDLGGQATLGSRPVHWRRRRGVTKPPSAEASGEPTVPPPPQPSPCSLWSNLLPEEVPLRTRHRCDDPAEQRGWAVCLTWRGSLRLCVERKRYGLTQRCINLCGSRGARRS